MLKNVRPHPCQPHKEKESGRDATRRLGVRLSEAVLPDADEVNFNVVVFDVEVAVKVFYLNG